MTIQAVVRLNTIHCIAERDSAYSSGSEPYVWGFLAGLGSNPLSLDTSPDFPILAESRKILKNNMKAGESATMDFPGNLFVQNFENGQEDCRLIFILALLEADELPDSAMQDGYQAFVDELRAQIPHIVGLAGLSEDDQKEAMKPIIAAVQGKVFDAVENSLSTSEKISVALGFTDKDDFVAAAFRYFEAIEKVTAPEPFTLRLSGDPIKLSVSTFQTISFPREFEVSGELTVSGVPVDPCQGNVDGLKAAEDHLRKLQAQLVKLRARLETEPRSEQDAIRTLIETLMTVEIPEARRRVNLAQIGLRNCRVFGGGLESPVEHPVVEPIG